MPATLFVMVLFVGAEGLLALGGTAEPPTSGKHVGRAQNENGAGPAGAKDDSLASQRSLPSPDFLPSCLKLIRQHQTAQARELLEPVFADHP